VDHDCRNWVLLLAPPSTNRVPHATRQGRLSPLGLGRRQDLLFADGDCPSKTSLGAPTLRDEACQNGGPRRDSSGSS
jgi:hypothetical protein